MNVALFYSAFLNSEKMAKLVQERDSEAAWFSDILSGEHHYELLVHSGKEAFLKVSSQ